jgi:hypothetical protein
MDPLLALVPTLARTGLANLLFDRKDGDPTAQARQVVRDVEEMPAELNRAAKLTSLGNKPLIVLSAGTGSLPGWAAQQNDLATLSTNSGPPHHPRRHARFPHRRHRRRRAIEPCHPRRRQGRAHGRRVMDDHTAPSAQLAARRAMSHDAAAAAFPSPRENRAGPLKR